MVLIIRIMKLYLIFTGILPVFTLCCPQSFPIGCVVPLPHMSDKVEQGKKRPFGSEINDNSLGLGGGT